MSFEDKRDQWVPSIPDSFIRPDSIGIADTKRFAWAFAIGQRRQPDGPNRPSRRGDLPDVDFSQVVRVARPSIWSRLAAAFRANSPVASAAEEPMLEIPHKAELQPAADNVIPFRRAA